MNGSMARGLWGAQEPELLLLENAVAIFPESTNIILTGPAGAGSRNAAQAK